MSVPTAIVAQCRPERLAQVHQDRGRIGQIQTVADGGRPNVVRLDEQLLQLAEGVVKQGSELLIVILLIPYSFIGLAFILPLLLLDILLIQPIH